jgi:hypothetical protein
MAFFINAWFVAASAFGEAQGTRFAFPAQIHKPSDACCFAAPQFENAPSNEANLSYQVAAIPLCSPPAFRNELGARTAEEFCDMSGSASNGSKDAQVTGSSGPQMSQDPLQERIRSAAAIVTGTVREIRRPSEVVQSAAGGLRISEHNPMLAEAVIAVKTGIKGAKDGDEVVVRFPTSTDVMWRNYPKFEVGQTGMFILQPDLLAGASAQSALASGPSAYSVRQRSDVLPLTEEGRVKHLSN